MLSSDHFGPPGDRRPGAAAHGAGPSGDPNEPWDAQSAEALTRLYESDEGGFWRPHPIERADRVRPQPKAHAPAQGAEGAERAWLESQFSDLAQRLQVSLSRLNPDKSLAALSGRIEAIEERFSIALERVAQRADVDGLRSIEGHVLELAGHLEQTRERLEQIGLLEDEVRGLARRVDEGDQQQFGALGKLLRDYVAEWRESEQRTAGALLNLEEAINRLGDTVDAMEASKPAPDLSLPPPAVPQAGRARAAGDFAQADRALTPGGYHSMLDATDYTLRTSEPGTRPAAKGTLSAETVIDWSSDLVGANQGRPVASEPRPRSSRITALRARLRQVQASSGEREAFPPAVEPPRPAASRRTRPGLLFIAGVAFLAGGAFLLVQAFKAAAPPPAASPARIEPGAQPAGAKQGVADPSIKPAAG